MNTFFLNPEVLSPSIVFALPKGTPKIRKRKGGRSEIMTSSPFKNQKLQAETEKNRKRANEDPEKATEN